MLPDNLQFWRRIKQFYEQARSFRPDRRTWIFITGWLFTFICLFWPVDFLLNPLTFIIWFFFWFKLTDIVYRRLSPPGDFLLLLYFLIFCLFFLFRASSVSDTVANTFLHGANLIILSLLVLIFSSLLVCSENGKRGGLVAYTLLFYIGLNVVYHQETVYLVLFQGILFLIALRRTNWLETLTKTECYLYFAVIFILFRLFLNLEPYSTLSSNLPDNAFAWIGLPKFLYYAFKMYLLAVLVKIPLVLVYNFATLSRKLRISSFFQSTFPQFIQLGMLVVVFYFTLAGWQAEKVRQTCIAETTRITNGRVPSGITTFSATTDKLEEALIASGYFPWQFQESDVPDRGIIKVHRNAMIPFRDETPHDFFFFMKDDGNGQQLYRFVKLDSTFLQTVSDHTSVLVGTHLRASPYQPPPWEGFFLNFDLLTENKLRISPFGLLPGRSDTALRVPIRQEIEVSSPVSMNPAAVITGPEFIVGRVIAPLLTEDSRENGFFVVEITLVPGGYSFLTPNLVSYVLLLVGAYLVINFFVIQRMTKLGSEINRIIVQKFSQLRSGIQEISAGNLDFRLHLEGRDEFVELADHFNQMGAKLKKSLAEAREKERLQQELAIARKVQLDLLPEQLPDIPGFETSAVLQTANEVGGDFYDVIPLSRNQYLVTVGDVSGKGTSAALYMAQCVSLIRYSHHFTDDPRVIAVRLNHYFANPEVDRQIFVTAIIGVLDIKKSTFSFIRAGHLPPLLLSADDAKPVTEILSPGLGLGLDAGKKFEKNLKVKSLLFKDDDVLVLITDGVVEASRPGSTDSDKADSIYGEKRLTSLLQSARGQSAEEIVRMINLDISAFYNRAAFVDDFTILVLKKHTD
jgi:serine phosphatase RsbU (regulator of sigma subunit)